MYQAPTMSNIAVTLRRYLLLPPILLSLATLLLILRNTTLTGDSSPIVVLPTSGDDGGSGGDVISGSRRRCRLRHDYIRGVGIGNKMFFYASMLGYEYDIEYRLFTAMLMLLIRYRK